MGHMRSKGAVLVTGASRGIGRATVKTLAGVGFTVYGTVRTDGDATRLIEETQGAVTPVRCDITDEEAVEAASDFMTDRVGRRGLVGLVNNAGIARAGPLEGLPLAIWQEQFEVNVWGVVRMTRAFLPLLRKGQGRIINVSSSNALVAIRYLGPYVVSKTALERLSEVLRLELRPWHIPVVVMQPGLVDTDIVARSLGVSEELLAQAGAEVRALYGSHIARVHRLAKDRASGGMPPERVARVILRALTTKRPRRIYRVGWEPRLFAMLVHWAPAAWKEWLAERILLRSEGS